jgi:signal transduction histidine kinase
VTRRLVLSYVAVAILILVVLEVPLGLVAARHERGLAAGEAQRDATSLSVAAGEAIEHGRPGDLATVASRYQAQTGGEVAIVNAAGQTLARSASDTDNDVTGDEKDLVQDALDGRSVSSFASDEGRPWAHAAVPIAETSEPDGAVLVGVPARSVEERVHMIWIGLAAFGLGLIALTALVGLLLARSLARPLGRLEATVSEFADGKLEVRAGSEDGPHEVRALAQEFNRMAARLSDLLEAQRRFVADASHQLRSPLTALRLRLENLEADPHGPPTEAVRAAGREVNRLSRIVDGLLALGRAGSDGPERQFVDLSQVIEERCDAWSALAEERRVSLVPLPGPDRAAGALLVPGDLDQILDNLLANALDVTSEGGHISVILTRSTPRQLEVHVVDDGPGMGEEDRQRAFDRFWQGPGSRGGHSGLGLAIVRQLCSRNQASVELRQADPVGLDAVVTLLVAPASARAASAETAPIRTPTPGV